MGFSDFCRDSIRTGTRDLLLITGFCNYPVFKFCTNFPPKHMFVSYSYCMVTGLLINPCIACIQSTTRLGRSLMWKNCYSSLSGLINLVFWRSDLRLIKRAKNWQSPSVLQIWDPVFFYSGIRDGKKSISGSGMNNPVRYWYAICDCLIKNLCHGRQCCGFRLIPDLKSFWMTQNCKNSFRNSLSNIKFASWIRIYNPDALCPLQPDPEL